MSAFIRSWSKRVELIVILTIAFGVQTVSSLMYLLLPLPDTRDWNDMHFVRLIVGELLVVSLCLLILHVRGWSFKDFRIQPGWRATGMGIVVAIVTLLITTSTATAYSYAYWLGQIYMHLPPPRHDYMGKVTASLGIIALTSLINPFAEEMFVTAYIIERCEPRFGARGAIVLSTLVRTLYHLYQGPLALLQILPTGLIFAGFYVRRRNLWPLLAAHILMDMIGLMANLYRHSH